MQRKLTITIADDVYRGLHHRVGRGDISRVIEDLVRPHVVTAGALEAEYREAARECLTERIGALTQPDLLAVEQAIRV